MSQDVRARLETIVGGTKEELYSLAIREGVKPDLIFYEAATTRMMLKVAQAVDEFKAFLNEQDNKTLDRVVEIFSETALCSDSTEEAQSKMIAAIKNVGDFQCLTS